MIDTRRDMDPVALLLSLFTTVVLLLTSPTRSLAAEESRDIAFHRIVSKDRGVTPSDSARYERRVVEEGAGKREFVIERKPAHVIPNAAIESVTIRKTKAFTASGEFLPDGADEGSEIKWNSKGMSWGILPKFYDLTFKLRSPEGKLFSEFTKKNGQGEFQSMIGKISIGIHGFEYAFEPDKSGNIAFTIYLREDDESKFRQMLSPFKDRLIWK
jgi:hypothetical protein